MQWIEVTIKTAPGAIDLVCDRLTVLGFDSFIVDDQDQFHEFLEENRQYWDYVDEGLEQQMRLHACDEHARGKRLFDIVVRAASSFATPSSSPSV